MRTFDFTNGKQFPETLHVSKSVPYDLFGRHHRMDSFLWRSLYDRYRRKIPRVSLLDDFVDYVINRVPIYFVNTNQIGQMIEVRETTQHVTVVPDNHLTVPQIIMKEMGRGYGAWENTFLERLERGIDDSDTHEPPLDNEINFDLNEWDETRVEIEAEALYCPTGGDPECKESNPEIFVYMDYFVDSYGRRTRPEAYMYYVIAHELTHAIMDEQLWETFLCKKGQSLSRGLSHKSRNYYLHEESLATAVGWWMVGLDSDVAREIRKCGLPYSFGLSPYYFRLHDRGMMPHCILLQRRIYEWLSTKMYDPTPYL